METNESSHLPEPVPYPFAYSFGAERNFDKQSFSQWMQKNWTLSFAYSMVYIVLVFGGKWYMESRPKFDLKVPLGIWSTILGIFSIAGFIRTAPELLHTLYVSGLETSVCDPSFFTKIPTSLWAFLFVISKVYELGDTIFIVLRKQKLIFLHWYHHITVLIYVWHSYTEETAVGRWFMVMNYGVHSVMYTYYALKAFKFYVPRSVNVFITALQLLQMVLGLSTNLYVYTIKANGRMCKQSETNWIAATLMYLSYFMLFAFFFYDSYLKPKPKTRVDNNENVVNGRTTTQLLKETKKLQ